MVEWIFAHIVWLAPVGLALLVLSVVRITVRLPPVKLLLVPGLIVGSACVIAAFIVLRAPPAPNTVPERPDPAPRPPIPTTTLERLRQPWDSEGPAHWPVAETMATMSDLAYLPPVDAHEQFLKFGFDKFMPTVAGSMLGYVLSIADVTVIVFRGTDAGDVGDWIANVNLREAQTPFGPIHDGFYAAYLSMKPQVVKVIAERKPKHIWITGHSLGGALAIACAFDLMLTEWTVDGVITFGQPRIAKAQLARHIDTVLLGKFATFVNNADVVPRLPPGYLECGSLVWFKNGRIDRSPPKRLVYGQKKDKGANIIEDSQTIAPLTDAEFEKLKTKIRLKNAEQRKLPDGKLVYEGNLPLINDHSMSQYLDKVRSLVRATGSLPRPE